MLKDNTPKEYIERGAILQEMTTKPLPGDAQHLYLAMRNIVKKAPTADVVEVVRCGECEHFHEYNVAGTKDPSGWGKCEQISMDVDLTINDFCSYGERKVE